MKGSAEDTRAQLLLALKKDLAEVLRACEAENPSSSETHDVAATPPRPTIAALPRQSGWQATAAASATFETMVAEKMASRRASAEPVCDYDFASNPYFRRRRKRFRMRENHVQELTVGTFVLRTFAVPELADLLLKLLRAMAWTGRAAVELLPPAPGLARSRGPSREPIFATALPRTGVRV